MMKNTTALVPGLILSGVAVANLIGKRRESARVNRLVDALMQGCLQQLARPVASSDFAELPAPVARYFRYALRDGQQPIGVATMRQVGTLRATTTSRHWASFTATQIIVPTAPGFAWNARVTMPLGSHIRILDSYNAGTGSGSVSFLSVIAVASATGAPELNSGALHRYLAEAVWYPTALLPGSGVSWTPINDLAALATLTDRGTTVSLEFRFNEIGEVTGIYSPGRFGAFDGIYRQAPWEGHFKNYELQSGVRVPTCGEAGWYDAGVWQAVWKGRLLELRYVFAG
jgi:hypothetical protein